MVTTLELSDKLFKQGTYYNDNRDSNYSFGWRAEQCFLFARIAANANDIGLPLSVVQQLLKELNYEQLLS